MTSRKKQQLAKAILAEDAMMRLWDHVCYSAMARIHLKNHYASLYSLLAAGCQLTHTGELIPSAEEMSAEGMGPE